jgi:circadian clock protein KaiB
MSEPPSRTSNTPPGVTLFVTGEAPRSQRARHHLRHALDQMGADPDGFQEIDLIEQPQQAFEHGILATPALLHQGGAQPPRKLYGDLSEEARLRDFLTGVGSRADPVA